MTEYPFDITPFHPPQNPPQNPQSPPPNSYPSLLNTFTTSNYGLYTEYFIRKMAGDAFQGGYLEEGKLPLKREIRAVVRKFMMTDLEVVFLGYYCMAARWDLGAVEGLCRDWGQIDEFQQYFNQSNHGPRDTKQKYLQFFLHLYAYFIKSYIGNPTEHTQIHSHLLHSFPSFATLYQKWILTQPPQTFIITPRQINQLYREYSRSQVMEGGRKSYDELVDTLIELSTTYSIIPGRKVGGVQGRKEETYHQKQKQKTGKDKQKEIKAASRHRLDQPQNSHRKHKNSSEIFQIVQNSDIVQEEQSQLNRFDMDFNANSGYRRGKRKSSLLFQSLQSLSRKSQQMLTRNKEQEQNREKQKQRQRLNQKQQQPQRSRDKKPNKISLTFKRKQQKPNETVLGFLKKKPSIQVGQQEDPKNPRASGGGGPNPITFRDGQPHNMSFINLRSNRSSRSNSQLPFLWRPLEDNFFQKSKFG